MAIAALKLNIFFHSYYQIILSCLVMLGNNGLELILKGSTVCHIGVGEFTIHGSKEVENSLALTCIKSECPGHSQRRGRGGGGWSKGFK